MNPIENLIEGFRGLVAQVPDILQPLILFLGGMVPFIEGEVAGMIGVLGGVNPVIAGLAAAAGNFLCVFVIVVLGARIRAAAVARRARRNLGDGGTEPKPESKGAVRVKRYLNRFGVPGASLLGPLAMPTQFTAALLVGSGVAKPWVLLWQAIAIVLWTTITVVSSSLALLLVYNVG